MDHIVYRDGDPIPTDDPCETCRCRPPGFSCVLRECEVKTGCRAIRRIGECCPLYQCGKIWLMMFNEDYVAMFCFIYSIIYFIFLVQVVNTTVTIIEMVIVFPTPKVLVTHATVRVVQSPVHWQTVNSDSTASLNIWLVNAVHATTIVPQVVLHL